MNKNTDPLVSIIVITYNSAKYVLETLESAKDQTYENIELIISDDGSKDDTVEICRNWIEENKGKFINTELITIEKNTGIPANCNRGVRASKGEWIKLIAGDDALYEDCIEKNLEYVKKNPCAKVVVSNLVKYNNTFNNQNILDVKSYSNFEFFTLNAPQQYNLLLRMDRVMTTPTLFINKSVYKFVKYDERFKLIEDYPFWLNVTKHGIKIHFFDDVTVKYRQSDSSVNNYKSNDIVKNSYFRNEELRQVYVYPNLPFFERLREKYNYLVFYFLKKFYLLKKSKLNYFLVELLTRFLNPFAILASLKRRFIYKYL